MSSGPFETEAEARAVATWTPTDRTAGLVAGVDRLEGAAKRTGAEAGAYDRRILCWLAGALTPQEVEVVASLIERAYDAGYDEGKADGIGQPLADTRPDAEQDR